MWYWFLGQHLPRMSQETNKHLAFKNNPDQVKFHEASYRNGQITFSVFHNLNIKLDNSTLAMV